MVTAPSLLYLACRYLITEAPLDVDWYEPGLGVTRVLICFYLAAIVAVTTLIWQVKGPISTRRSVLAYFVCISLAIIVAEWWSWNPLLVDPVRLDVTSGEPDVEIDLDRRETRVHRVQNDERGDRFTIAPAYLIHGMPPGMAMRPKTVQATISDGAGFSLEAEPPSVRSRWLAFNKGINDTAAQDLLMLAGQFGRDTVIVSDKRRQDWRPSVLSWPADQLDDHLDRPLNLSYRIEGEALALEPVASVPIETGARGGTANLQFELYVPPSNSGRGRRLGLRMRAPQFYLAKHERWRRTEPWERVGGFLFVVHDKRHDRAHLAQHGGLQSRRADLSRFPVFDFELNFEGASKTSWLWGSMIGRTASFVYSGV